MFTKTSLIIIGTLSSVSIPSTDISFSNIKNRIPRNGKERVIIGYHRLDFGVPVVGEYINKGSPKIFASPVPGAKYRITAWRLGGGDDRRRSQSPAVREVTIRERSELMYRNTHISCNIVPQVLSDSPQAHLLQDTSL